MRSYRKAGMYTLLLLVVPFLAVPSAYSFTAKATYPSVVDVLHNKTSTVHDLILAIARSPSSVNGTCRDERVPVLFCAFDRGVEFTRVLFEHDVDVDASYTDRRGPRHSMHWTPLDWLEQMFVSEDERRGDEIELMVLMSLRYGVSLPRPPDRDKGATALMWALHAGMPRVVDALLSKAENAGNARALVRTRTQYKRTALMKASCPRSAHRLRREAWIPVMQRLLRHGAQPNSRDNHGRHTPLTVATACRWVSHVQWNANQTDGLAIAIVNLLVKHGADVNAVVGEPVWKIVPASVVYPVYPRRPWHVRWAHPPLVQAVMDHHVKMTETLLGLGARVGTVTSLLPHALDVSS
eukprot:TRINITY_DN588_c0_g1_i7.p1 TRINITY_DN588_c0_g1~~TRINITY_DN588_c0_g1_i7.p1  ORF type:complete len:352 (+),score=-19.24 TRINITY_DN588_c0_g1_i7:411-1466(+)